MSIEDKSVMRRAQKIPDEFTFVDEDGKPLPELGKFRPDFWHKLVIARCSLKWKQSIQVTMERMIRNAVFEYAARHPAESPSMVDCGSKKD